MHGRATALQFSYLHGVFLPPHHRPLLLAVLAALAFHLTAWGGWDEFVRSIDFNGAPFEDFIGPYYTTGISIFETRAPAPGFYYSPFFAILLGVFDGMTPRAASSVWLGVELLSTVALVLLPLAILRPSRPIERGVYLFVALTAFPLVHNFHWGQVSVPLYALILGALLADRRGWRTSSALLLALAISVKFYPALLLAAFLVRGDVRYVATCGAFCALFLAAIPALVLGGDATIEFYRLIAAGVQGAESSEGLWLDAPNRQSLAAVLQRVFGPGEGGARLLAFQLAGWVWAAANLVMIQRLDRSPDPERGPFAFTLLMLSIPLVVSPTWPHTLAYLPFCQLYLWRRCSAAGSWAVLGRVVVAISCLLSSVILFRIVDSPAQFGRAGFLAAANLLLLLVAGVLAFEPASTPRQPSDRPR